jgi:hypothetical protein
MRILVPLTNASFVFKFLISKTFNTNLCGGKPLIVKEFCISLRTVFFLINNLNKLPLGVDFTTGELNQLQIIHSAFAPDSLLIYSANSLHCMNVNNECFILFYLMYLLFATRIIHT